MTKETGEVFHQPRLLATLVLGPFLVMGAFGVGLSDQLPRFSALFVAPESSDIGSVVDRYAEELADYIDYRGVTVDDAAARERLGDGEVDVVAVLPDRPLESIRRDRRAVIEVYHRSLDPIIGAAIEGAARLAADEINRQVLASVVAEGQAATALLDDVLPRVELAVRAARVALEVGDRVGAETRIEEVRPELEDVVDAVGNTLSLADGLGPSSDVISGSELRRTVRRLWYPPSIVSLEERDAQLAVVESALADARMNLETLREVRPEVLIRPFRARTHSTTPDLGSPLAFYIPAILVLLLQHLGVTFAALSLVRERDLGAVELFAVAPITSGEILLGKCASYLALGGLVAAVLLVAVDRGLGIDFVGSWGHALAALVAVLLASIGLGFVISLVSKSDSQAVQLAMLSLLASFFFSGFFLPLDRLGSLAGWIGTALPATHGIAASRNIMLRGESLAAGDLGALVVVATVTLVVTRLGLARELSRG